MAVCEFCLVLYAASLDGGRNASSKSQFLTVSIFVRLRVNTWIESLPAENDPRNHTKYHEIQIAFLFMKPAGIDAVWDARGVATQLQNRGAVATGL